LIKRLIDIDKYPIIVKEVGHGMGFYSLSALMELPLLAIDFAANGGTNFSKIELSRTTDDSRKHIYDDLAQIGHSAEEMVNYVNIYLSLGRECACKKFIISGGVKTFLDGYYHINKIMAPAVYGQAAPLLQYAMGDYEPLQNHLHLHIEGLKLAYALLKVKVDLNVLPKNKIS
jgi:isopentenyl-diphosphate delta-isomerase